MYCTVCGAEIPSGALFCSSCGTRIDAMPEEPKPYNGRYSQQSHTEKPQPEQPRQEQPQQGQPQQRQQGTNAYGNQPNPPQGGGYGSTAGRGNQQQHYQQYPPMYSSNTNYDNTGSEHGAGPGTQAHISIYNATLGDSIRSFFTRYVDFSGRSSRAEYWYFYAFHLVALIALTILSKEFGGVFYILMSIYSFAVIIPNIALSFRRMHDTGRSGWYLFISCIPMVGAFMLLYYCCQDSDGDNIYGPHPTYVNRRQ